MMKSLKAYIKRLAVFGVMCCVLSVAVAGEWVAYSPNTLTIKKVNDTVIADAVEIAFRPRAGLGDPKGYWCSAQLNFNPPIDTGAVTFALKADRQRPMAIKLFDGRGVAGYYHFTASESWTRMTLRTNGPDFIEGGNGPLQSITRVEFIFNSNQDKNPLFFRTGGFGAGSAAPKPEEERDRRWMPPGGLPARVPGKRIETTIWNTWTKGSGWGEGDADFTGFNNPQGARVTREIIDYFASLNVDVGIDFPYLADEWGKELAQYARERGIQVFSECHNTPSKEWMEEHGGFAVFRNGKNAWEMKVDDLSQYYDKTNPDVLEFVRQRHLAAARAGATRMRVVDDVWPYWGGPYWGFSKSAIKRWRENLKGTDAGIESIDAAGNIRTYSFMDYAHSYLGYKPVPADCGLASWDEYSPPREGEPENIFTIERQRLFTLLYHYEWVKFPNEVSRVTVPEGLEYQPIVNPEYQFNGTDLAWLFRARFVAGFCSEWWASADVVLPNYYNGSYYHDISLKYGKEFSNLGESAAAGGSPFWGKDGRPHYWDNPTNYLITYLQTAATGFTGKNDQYWASNPERMQDPKRREHDSWTAFISSWSGFLQAWHDEAAKPRTGLMAVGMRPIMQNTASFDRGRSDQEYNIARHLYAMNIIHDGVAFPADGFSLKDYNTVLYSPYEPPVDFAHDLAAWAEAGGTIVTHSFVPSRRAAPVREYPAGAAAGVQDRELAARFGLANLRVGTTVRGKLTVSDPAMKIFLANYDGKNFQLSSPLYEADGGTPLALLGDKPLVSEFKTGRGRVLYLHFLPAKKAVGGGRFEQKMLEAGRQSDAFEAAVLQAVLARTGHESTAETPTDCYALRLDRPTGHVFLIYNDRANTMMQRGDEVFNCYQARDPKVTASARLRLAPGNYRLTDLITGESWNAASDGWLSLSLDGWNMRGVYLQSQ